MMDYGSGNSAFRLLFDGGKSVACSNKLEET